MNEPSTIPASEPLASMLPDASSPHTEVYHNVKIGNCPALRAPKVPTGTTIEVSDLAKSPMLLAPERVAAYLRANPEVTVAIMSGLVRPAMLKELSRAARGVLPCQGCKEKVSHHCHIQGRHVRYRGEK